VGKHWTGVLADLGACTDAAWAACERGDWMLWWLGRMSGPPGSPLRRALVGHNRDRGALALIVACIVDIERRSAQ